MRKPLAGKQRPLLAEGFRRVNSRWPATFRPGDRTLGRTGLDPVMSYWATLHPEIRSRQDGPLMTMQRPKILLSEGSSLSARETITALGLAGHRVELVSAESFCLGRFSRFVSRVHPAPASGADPDGYLAAVLEIVKRRSIDVLLPVQEQAYLFAAARRRLPADLGIALSDFASFEQVQSKAGLAELLTQLKVP